MRERTCPTTVTASPVGSRKGVRRGYRVVLTIYMAPNYILWKERTALSFKKNSFLFTVSTAKHKSILVIFKLLSAPTAKNHA